MTTIGKAVGAIISGDYKRLTYTMEGNTLIFEVPLRERDSCIVVCCVRIDNNELTIWRAGKNEPLKMLDSDPELVPKLKAWMAANASNFIDLAETLW